MSDIFISYAGEDRDRVRELAVALERQGWEVWWDRKSIAAGELFDEVIDKELNAAKSVVVVWTTTSVKSHWVKDEATVGWERNVLVPVLLEPEPFKPPLGFRQIHGAELFDWNGDETSHAFLKLISDLTRVIGAKLQTSTDAPGNAIIRISAPPVTVHITEPPAAKPEQHLRVSVHRAFFEGDPAEKFFVNVVNQSADQQVELTHVWYEGSKRVDIVEIARSLPKLLGPSESWETWVSAADVPSDDNPFQNFRVRTSTEEVVASTQNVGVPRRGFVPGGLVTAPPHVRQIARMGSELPQSFFAHDGSDDKYRASNFVLFVASPTISEETILDKEKQRSFNRAVKHAFRETVGFDRRIIRGQYYQIESDASYRSCSHRGWFFGEIGQIGCSANLETKRDVMVSDLALHYVFFVRLCESMFSPSQSIDLSLTLTCPSAELAPFFPDPDGGHEDYDQVDVRFNQREPYLPKSNVATSALSAAREPVALARLVFRQLQEVAGAEARLESWVECFSSLSRQTRAPSWGMLR